MIEVFYEIIKEANKGKVIIDGDDFYIGFNSIIYDKHKVKFSNNEDNGMPTLIIKDELLFYLKMEEYIKLVFNSSRKMPHFVNDANANNIKLIISYIFANATTEDFLNPIGLIDRNIKFLKDDTLSYLEDTSKTDNLNFFMNSHVEIKNTGQSVFMETPNKIDIRLCNYIDNDKVIYQLPSISYGIVSENSDKVCYIYSMLNPKNQNEKSDNQKKYEKKISREMYKINAGVKNQESEEYQSYNPSVDDYYPENISDVSPSSLISLTVFLGLLKKENIDIIKVVPYLPVRFLSRETFANELDDEEKQNELKARNNFLQRNITDKFIRTFRRIGYHHQNLNINSYPYEIDEFMNISISSDEDHFNNEILSEIYFSTLSSLHRTKKR